MQIEQSYTANRQSAIAQSLRNLSSWLEILQVAGILLNWAVSLLPIIKAELLEGGEA